MKERGRKRNLEKKNFLARNWEKKQQRETNFRSKSFFVREGEEKGQYICIKRKLWSKEDMLHRGLIWALESQSLTGLSLLSFSVVLGLFQWQSLNRNGTLLLLVAQRDFLGRSDGEFYLNGISNSVWHYSHFYEGEVYFWASCGFIRILFNVSRTICLIHEMFKIWNTVTLLTDLACVFVCASAH